MLTNYEPDWNIDDLTDSEIYAAIRYLEQPPRGADKQHDDRSVMIGLGFVLFLFGCLAFMMLYWRG